MAEQHSPEFAKLRDQERAVRESFWPKLARNLSFLPFADKFAAAYYCAMDPQTPFKVRATLVGALAYFILPLDVIPDMLLGLGFTDDMAVLVTAFTMLRNHMSQDHLDKGRRTVERLRRGGDVQFT